MVGQLREHAADPGCSESSEMRGARILERADPDYWKGEVFAYVGRNQNLKDLKALPFQAPSGAACSRGRGHGGDYGGVISVDRDPLRDCWKRHAELDSFGQIADLARIVLAAPASNAPVERVFSEASLIMSKRRKRTDPENLSLLLFLHNGWDWARELELLKL